MSGDEPYAGPERRRDELSATAEELSGKVGKLTASVEDLASYGHRNRYLIRMNAVAMVVVAVLFVAVGLIGAVAFENRQNQKLSCQIGNESRAAQIRLWSYVLDASSANPNMTPQQEQLIAEFRIYINQVFAPRNCDDLTPQVKTPTPPAIPVPTTPAVPTRSVTPTR